MTFQKNKNIFPLFHKKTFLSKKKLCLVSSLFLVVEFIWCFTSKMIFRKLMSCQIFGDLLFAYWIQRKKVYTVKCRTGFCRMGDWDLLGVGDLRKSFTFKFCKAESCKIGPSHSQVNYFQYVMIVLKLLFVPVVGLVLLKKRKKLKEFWIRTFLVKKKKKKLN